MPLFFSVVVRWRVLPSLISCRRFSGCCGRRGQVSRAWSPTVRIGRHALLAAGHVSRPADVRLFARPFAAGAKSPCSQSGPHQQAAANTHKPRRRTALRAAGIIVRDDVDERGTSRTCPICRQAREANRIHRGWYRCPCGWTAHADVNGALNLYERAFQVSPIKGSSGRVARPVVVLFQSGWHTVHEPKRKNLRASA